MIIVSREISVTKNKQRSCSRSYWKNLTGYTLAKNKQRNEHTKQKEKFMEHQEMYSMQGPTDIKQYEIFKISLNIITLVL